MTDNPKPSHQTTGPDANGWAKIEEADKSNGPVILTDGGYYLTGFWQDGYGWMAGWNSPEVQVRLILQPTHFRPLPSGPVKEDQNG